MVETQLHYNRNIRDYYQVTYTICTICGKQLSDLNNFDFHLFVKHKEVWDKRCS